MSNQEVYIGAGAMLISVATVSAPVLAVKYSKLKNAVKKYNIVYCDPCKTYRIGKHHMCNECIKKAAANPPPEPALPIEEKKEGGLLDKVSALQTLGKLIKSDT